MDNNIELKINKNIVIVVLCLIIGILVAYVVLNAVSGGQRTVVLETNDTNNTPIAPVTVEPVVPSFNITADQMNPELNIFTSTKLGITFKYLKYAYSDDENNPGINHSIMVQSPKIDDGMNEERILLSAGSSYLEIYHKEANQSLEAAIKAKFLLDVPSTQCLTSRVRAGADDAFYTPTSKISFVRLIESTPNGCPPMFDFTNQSAAFFSFSNMPDKFFYIIGESDTTMPLRTPTGDPFFLTIQALAQ